MSEADENERLHKAMVKLARVRDEASRKSMYMALLEATLYVPTELDPDQSEGHRFAADQPLRGEAVYTAFTRLEELTRWRPESAEHAAMTGAELMTVLASSSLASCLINPNGDVRGELYKHEVVTLAQAVPRLRAWRNPDHDE